MSLDLMHLQAEHEREQQPEHLPAWVSEKNKSLEAWRALQMLEKERQTYIKSHRKPQDFNKTSLWQIRASAVARAIGQSPSYLDPKRGVSWASAFCKELDTCNKELAKKKEQRLDTYRKNKAKGRAAKPRSEIDEQIRALEKENEKLKNKLNQLELEGVRSNLTLPIRKVLGIGS